MARKESIVIPAKPARSACSWTAALLLSALLPASAAALTQPTLADVGDPVPPGATLTYQIMLADITPAAPPPPTCFNPPSECMEKPVTCSNPPPSCVSNGMGGFVCTNATNDGANCGTGMPLAPDPGLCTPRSAGTCGGGNNAGLPCHVPDGELTTECPGTTDVCIRAFNEGDYCGTGNPPQPDNDFCLDHATGVCDAGPNYGMPCTAPHRQPTPDCPPSNPPAPPTAITVVLPIPTGTTFIDADNGGMSDGMNITWTVPPLGSCGIFPNPPCPVLTTHLQVSPLFPVDTFIHNQATATDGDGIVQSNVEGTKIGTFAGTLLVIRYPSLLRDSVRYQTRFTLDPGAMIDPANEAFRFQVSNLARGTFIDFSLPAGSLAPSGAAFVYLAKPPGLSLVRLTQLAPSNYLLVVRAKKLSLLDPGGDNNVTVTLTLGDDMLTQSLVLRPLRRNRKFQANKP
jgi:hypothetical protein